MVQFTDATVTVTAQHIAAGTFATACVHASATTHGQPNADRQR